MHFDLLLFEFITFASSSITGKKPKGGGHSQNRGSDLWPQLHPWPHYFGNAPDLGALPYTKGKD